jgi:Rha family phage regulatory protein
MTDIILSTQNGEPVASSRQIAESFEKNHRDVLRAVDNLKEDVRNFAQMFFETTVPDSYGREQRAYLMNRDGFTLLAMGFTGKAALEWKLKYIAAFNEMEKKLTEQPQLTRSQLLATALIAAHEELEEKDKRIKLLTADTERMKPKEIFSDAVSTSQNSILVGELAKLLKQNGIEIGEKRLYAWMRENGYLIKRKGADWNKPTQRSMEMKLFTIKETVICHSDGHTSVNTTTKVTGIGQVYFVNLFLKTEKNKKAED